MNRRLLPALVLALLPQRLPAAQPGAPPNAPADIRVEGDRILVVYDGATLFDGRIGNPGALRAAVPGVATRDGAVEQVLALFARQGEIEVAGTVAASVEAFPCESDRAFRALPVVRHSSGLSRSRLNQAVYDRRRDWVLSVDDQLRTPVTVTPLSDAPGGRTFALAARGREIVLRFRPRFYQRHRGLPLFEPWTYAVWPKPVVGWCCWFAFFDRVTDADVRRTADVVSEVLLPYGYDVPADRRRVPARDRAAGAVAQAEREVPGRAGGDRRLHPEEGARRPGSGRTRPSRRPSTPSSTGTASCATRRATSPAATGSTTRSTRRPTGALDDARPADLLGPARHGLGVLQARRPAPPPLRGVQLLPRALREEERRPRARRSAATWPPSARRSAATASCSRAGACGPSSSASSTAAASARTASPTPASPSTTRSTTWSGGTTPTTSS